MTDEPANDPPTDGEDGSTGPGTAGPDPDGTSTGKVDRESLEWILSRTGADREDVSLGPAYGVDFGLLDVDGQAVAVATDPLSILPALGYERAGRFALEIALADVAVSGLPPSHVAVAFHLPPDFDDDALRAVWRGMSETAADLGAAVVTGHTGRYAGCSLPWVGGVTAMAVGDPDVVVRPDGARPGDRLVVTKGPAVEAAALLASLFPDRLADRVAPSTADRARDLIAQASPVRDALAAAAAGPVTAMHDATERGLANALHEMAASAGVRFDVERSAVPLDPTVEAVCSAFGVDPWTAASAGTLLVTVRPERLEAVLSALAAEDIEAATVGEVSAGSGVYADGDSLDVPDRDSFARRYEDLVE